MWGTLVALLCCTVGVALSDTACNDQYCYPGSPCWPELQAFYDLIKMLDGTTLFASQPEYANNTIMYNTRVTRFPYLIVYVKNVDDVITCVEFANKHKIKISVRSSGHDYIGRSTGDGTLQINLREMKGLKFDLNSTRWADGEVRAESGNTWIRVYNESSKYGRTVIGGSAHTVSMGGYTLGGGHSPIGRKFGAAVDNLLEVEMVTANGSLVYADATSTTFVDRKTGAKTTSSNTDIFWALRGGGGSTFGIVTAFTYRLHVDSKMQTVTCYFPLYDFNFNPISRDFMDRLYKLLGNGLAPEWGGYHFFTAASPPGVFEKGALYLYMNHYGEMDSASYNTINPILSDLQQHCEFANKTNFLNYTSSGTDPLYYQSYIFNVLMQPDSFTDAFFNDLKTILYAKTPGMPDAGCTGTLIGGHMNDVHGDDTALNPNFRTAVMSLTCGIGWSEFAESPYVEYGEQLTDILLRHGKGTYFNEPSAHLPDWKERYWGGHYDRLLAIKKEWDPDNVFSCLHCVGSDLNQTTPIVMPVSAFIGRR